MFADVLMSDWGPLGGLRPSQRERSGSHLGGASAMRPAPTLPVGPCGRVWATASARGGHFMPAPALDPYTTATDRPRPAGRNTLRQPRQGDRESELAPAGYTCTVMYGRTYRACRTTQ